MKFNPIDILRNRIAADDAKLINILADRFSKSVEIGKYKQQLKTPIEDRNQEKEVILRAKEYARSFKVSEQFAEDLMRLIMRESRRIQSELPK